MGGKARMCNSTDSFSVMNGVAVLCKRRIVDGCDERFHRSNIKMLLKQDLKQRLLLRNRCAQIPLGGLLGREAVVQRILWRPPLK